MTLLALHAESLLEFGTFAIIAGVLSFLVLAAVAYIVFRLTRKTMKMAIRLIVVAVILLIALVGSVAVYWKSGSNNKQPRLRPSPTRSR